MADEQNQQTTNPTPDQQPAEAPDMQTIPPMETMPQHAGGGKHSLIFPILGGLLVALVLILGGLYLWGAILNQGGGDAMMEDEMAGDDAMMEETGDQAMQNDQTSGDNLNAIDQELQSEDYSSMEAELDAIGQEIDSEASAESNTKSGTQ